MAIEVHRGKYLYHRRVAERQTQTQHIFAESLQAIPSAEREQPPETAMPTPFMYRFIHDLESLWWIVLWILTARVDHPESNEWAANVYAYVLSPTNTRRDVFETDGELASALERVLHPKLGSCIYKLEYLRTALLGAYLSEDLFNNKHDPKAYIKVYKSVMSELGLLLVEMAKAKVPLIPSSPSLSATSTSVVLGKRQHLPPPKDDDDYQPSSPETVKQKKSKQEKARKQSSRRTTTCKVVAPRRPFPNL